MFLHLSVRHSVQGGCLALGLGVCLWVGGVHPPRTHTPLPRDTHIPSPDTPRLSPPPLPPHYSQQADSIYPTGMLSYLFFGAFFCISIR